MKGAVHLWVIAMTLTLSQGQLEENFVEYDVIEEQSPNTLVGDIVEDSGFRDRYSRATLRSFTYEFLSSKNIFTNYFTIESSGLLRTSRTLDRDFLCPGEPLCDLTLDIVVKPVTNFQIIKVTIHVIDINDNHPKFPKNDITWTVSESAMPGVTFAMPLASDPDSPPNGIQSYELLGNRDIFNLRVSTSSNRPSDVHLVLAKPVDREETSEYTLTLKAFDGGTPRQSGSLTVNVKISDANDNAPHFDNQTYQVEVFENIALDSTVIVVHATDRDHGDNGRLVYELSETSSAEFGDLFRVVPDTGEVIVTGPLDSDLGREEYVLGLVVRDSGISPLADYAKLTIKIQDINDHAPHVTINALTSSGGVQLSENSPLHTFVTHVSVIDPDKGKNGQFSCSLDDDNFQLQQMYTTEFKIISAAEFDREERDSYQANLICQDEGSPPKSTSELISISILDENDHPPEFPQDTYYVTFRENNTIGDQIIHINASDKDIGDNAQIEYAIRHLGGFPGSLVIDPASGRVRAAVVFDYESAVRYEYVITAKDKGEPPLSATATLIISLSDINDNAPVFNADSYQFGTFENQVAGTEIGTVHATDPDGPRHNQVTYDIDYSKGQGSDVFRIDSRSGKITAQRVLDHESIKSYKLVVTAGNYGYNLTTSVNVSIDVADKNDNAPIIIFPMDDNTTVNVPSTAEAGHVVSHIEAFDLDIGVNAYLRYEIVSGDTYGLFDINPVDGSLLVLSPLSDFADHSFRIGILVSDQGSPTMSAVTHLNIYVNNSAASLVKGLAGMDEGLLVIIVAGIVAVMLVCGLILLVLLVRRHQRRHLKYANPNTDKASDEGSHRGDDEATVVVRKDEISFKPSDGVIQNRFFDNGPWPHFDMIQDPQGHSTPLSNGQPCSPSSLASDHKYPRDDLPPPFPYDPHHRLYYCDQPRLSPGSQPAQLQPHDFLELLPAPSVNGDGGSDRGSLTDSGRGLSEEGDHQSPNSETTVPRRPTTLSPDHHPTRFTVYPPHTFKKPYNQSLPHPHHPQPMSPWKPMSYNDLRSQAKPVVPPRTSSMQNGSVPSLPPKGHRLKTFCPEDKDPPCKAKRSSSRTSLDCVSDDGTTTSGSYVVDLNDVAEADQLDDHVQV